ncbi:MAG: alkaline phosphatase family protein [Candidatus Acidiferrales bacterium]|jgi:hypothetical protein
MPAAIKRLVVLMLENRSFDHMLGFMKSPGGLLGGVPRWEECGFYFLLWRSQICSEFVTNDAIPKALV